MRMKPSARTQPPSFDGEVSTIINIVVPHSTDYGLGYLISG